MRENSKVRERYELSLDGTQVASVVVGALVVLGAVFVLGLNVGKQVAARAQPGAGPADDSLAALDRPAPRPPPPPEKEPKLSFHDALTKGPAAGAPLPSAAAAVPAVGTALDPLPASAPSASAAAPKAAVPAAPAAPARKAAPHPAPPKDAMASAVARVSGAPETGPSGAFAIQVGATQSEPEARRIQRKFAADGARVAVADLPGKGRWYRVKIGSFATRAEAEHRLASLKARGVAGFVTDAR